MNNTRKLIVGLGAVGAYVATVHLGAEGFAVVPLLVSAFASATAIALIIVEWSRV